MNGLQNCQNMDERKEVEEQNAQQLNTQYKIEIGKLKQQVKELKELNSDLNGAQSVATPAAQDGDEASNDPKQQTMQLKLQLRDQIIRANDLESQLIEAKMHWANLDMENDELAQKLQQKNQMLKVFSSQVTKLECELVQAK